MNIHFRSLGELREGRLHLSLESSREKRFFLYQQIFSELTAGSEVDDEESTKERIEQIKAPDDSLSYRSKPCKSEYNRRESVINVDESDPSDRYQTKEEEEKDEHEYRLDRSLTTFGILLIIGDSCDCGGVFGSNGSPVLEIRCFL